MSESAAGPIATGPANASWPIVFVSSTEKDLRPYRLQASEAASAEGLIPRKMEYWSAKDVHKPLTECMVQIAGDGRALAPSNVVVVIVAHRYGWEPPEQESGKSHSITWLECLKAQKCGQEVLPFIVDDDHVWPDELKEDYRVMQAVREGKPIDDITRIAEDVRRKQELLKQFKHWLSDRRICSKFTSPDDLYNKVRKALADWKSRHPELQPGPARVDDPKEYLRLLHQECSHIDIRGLQVGSGRATRIAINELYIPLTMARRGDREMESETVAGRIEKHVDLAEALQEKHVVIIGDPGAGKSTFLRRIAFVLCHTHLGHDPKAAAQELRLPDCPLPLLVRVGDLCEHISAKRAKKEGPASDHAPEWFVDFLSAASNDQRWGLSKAFFEHHLCNGTALVLLDGLDEAPTEWERKQISGLVQSAGAAFSKTRFVVTSRPAAYEGGAVLHDYARVQIEPLEEPAVEDFLRRWCENLIP